MNGVSLQRRLWEAVDDGASARGRHPACVARGRVRSQNFQHNRDKTDDLTHRVDADFADDGEDNMEVEKDKEEKDWEAEKKMKAKK